MSETQAPSESEILAALDAGVLSPREAFQLGTFLERLKWVARQCKHEPRGPQRDVAVQLLALLADSPRPRTRSDLAMTLGEDGHTVSTRLSELRAAGKVEKAGYQYRAPVWRLTTKGQQEAVGA